MNRYVHTHIHTYIHAYIHSFIHPGYFYSASSSTLLLRGAPDYSIDTVSEIHTEAPHATASEGLALVPVARVGFETAILQMQGAEHTTEPPRSAYIGLHTDRHADK